MPPKLVAEPATEQAGGKAERHPAGSFDRQGELEVEPVRGGAEGLRAGCLQPEITGSQESSPELVLSSDFRESMGDKNQDSFRVTWDGDFATWLDFVRKVRLAWERTRRRRRRYLGPELVSQLSGRAWLVTQEIDHKRLSQHDGSKYLLDYLENRLAKTPVPDAGVRAEELLLRLRRPPTMSMASWCQHVREAHRRLQRALQRARQEHTQLSKEAKTPGAQPDLPRAEQSPS